MSQPLSTTELTALVYSLRLLVENFLTPSTGEPILKPVSRPFNLLVELLAVRDALEAATTHSTDERLQALLDATTRHPETRPALRQIAQRIDRHQARFYTRLLIKRGVIKETLNPPRQETPEAEARMLEMVMVDAMMSVPVEVALEAMTVAYVESRNIDPDDQSPEAEVMRLAAQNYMKFLRSFIEAKRGGEPVAHGLPTATVH